MCSTGALGEDLSFSASYPENKLTQLRYSGFKQQERATRIANLPAEYHAPFTAANKSIINKPIQELVQDVHKGSLSRSEILRTYGKVAVRAQEKANCVTEFMLPEAEGWLDQADPKGPLAGIPVSLKDSVHVKGFDTSVGYSRNARSPQTEDGIMARLLKDAGTRSLIVMRHSMFKTDSLQGLFLT